MRMISGILLCGLLFGSPHAGEAPPTERSIDLELSETVAKLLREEMRDVADGMLKIAAALPLGDWETVETEATRIHSSYALEQQLDETQMSELLRLPDEFHRLDAALHSRAERLARAAEARDAEMVAFQYSRLLEDCVQCHATYAGPRFPGLQGVSPIEAEHRH